ncbi:SAM-dependent methyltransferase [Planomonospora corallina]|uniref:SAM-dependent methyltransferase n=1 Tax=Planomonospora corallina TaxID=1806052 RepID=A0ABV8IEN4_9ACTN
MGESGNVPPGVDPTVPSAARMYDYGLGGKDNFEIDRQIGDQMRAKFPQLSDLARGNRNCLIRCVEYLARDRGIKRFLDIGSGLPTQENVHQVIQRVHPDARTVYVDSDPTARVHALALLDGDPRTSFIQADAADPAAILNHPDTQELLSAGEPVAVLWFAVAHFLPDSADPRGAIARLMAAVPSGSVLALSHVTSDGIDPDVDRGFRDGGFYDRVPTPLVMRTEKQVAALFGGLPIVGGRLVEVGEWGRTDAGAPRTGTKPLRALFGYAVKP